jgi:ER-derived vesicles protein
MASRISIARPQTNTFNTDPHGLSNSRPSSGYRAANPDDPLEKLRAISQQVEDNIEIYSQPLKPHLPAIGRFLIVVTFLEDALRILTQWGDQIWYLQQCAKPTPFTAVLVADDSYLDIENSLGEYHTYFFLSISL